MYITDDIFGKCSKCSLSENGIQCGMPKKIGSTHDVILVHCTAFSLVKWFPIRLFDVGLATHTPFLGAIQA